MDKRRAFAALLTLVAVSAAPPLPIREANWITPAARVEALTTEPMQCGLLQPDDVEKNQIGAVAFGTPFLLGGQAARAGLSCASCHQNGRGNPHFIFPGISGAPGTADVTASLLSSHRGDGTFNPKPIPDLAVDQPKVPPSELRRFIRGLIVEEFDGPEPPARVLDGLATFVRIASAEKCAASVKKVTLETSLNRLRLAIYMGWELSDTPDRFTNNDLPTARLMVLAARSELGRIDERFSAPRFVRERVRLDAHDGTLRNILRLLDEGNDAAAPALNDAQRIPELIRADLGWRERRSLYNPKILRKSLNP